MLHSILRRLLALAAAGALAGGVLGAAGLVSAASGSASVPLSAPVTAPSSLTVGTVSYGTPSNALAFASGSAGQTVGLASGSWARIPLTFSGCSTWNVSAYASAFSGTNPSNSMPGSAVEWQANGTSTWTPLSTSASAPTTLGSGIPVSSNYFGINNANGYYGLLQLVIPAGTAADTYSGTLNLTFSCS
jgi:hypothetical protein